MANAFITTLYVGFDSDNGNNSATNRDILLEELDARFPDGYTVIDAIGRFGGVPENSAQIVLICREDTPTERAEFATAAYGLAQAYKKRAGQKEVWVTHRQENLVVF